MPSKNLVAGCHRSVFTPQHSSPVHALLMFCLFGFSSFQQHTKRPPRETADALGARAGQRRRRWRVSALLGGTIRGIPPPVVAHRDDLAARKGKRGVRRQRGVKPHITAGALFIFIFLYFRVHLRVLQSCNFAILMSSFGRGGEGKGSFKTAWGY